MTLHREPLSKINYQPALLFYTRFKILAKIIKQNRFFGQKKMLTERTALLATSWDHRTLNSGNIGEVMYAERYFF